MIIIKLWIDESYSPSDDYTWLENTKEAINFIKKCIDNKKRFYPFGQDLWDINSIDISANIKDYDILFDFIISNNPCSVYTHCIGEDIND